jgi:hypothetical protein
MRPRPMNRTRQLVLAKANIGIANIEAEAHPRMSSSLLDRHFQLKVMPMSPGMPPGKSTISYLTL